MGTEDLYCDDGTMRLHSNELGAMLTSAAKSLSQEESVSRDVSRDFSQDFSREDDNWVDLENNPALANVQQPPTSLAKEASEASRLTGQEILTEKLLEGYVLEGSVCGKCIMPKMSYKGKVTCVVCASFHTDFTGAKNLKKKNKTPMSPRLVKAMSETDSALETMMKNVGSEESNSVESNERGADMAKAEEDELNPVDRMANECSDKRTKATEIYTAKILEGYAMSENMCEKCDMPLMSYKDTVKCVFCKEEEEVSEEEEKDVAEEANKLDDEKASNPDENVSAESENAESNGDVVPCEEQTETPLMQEEKPMSRAEKLAERLRTMKSLGKKEGYEQELDRAEEEIIEMIKCLEMHEDQNDNLNMTMEDYFAKKGAASSAMTEFQKKIMMKEQKFSGNNDDTVLEAEAVPKTDDRNHHEQHHNEDWDTRVFEGRALMNRRRLQGWAILNEVCAGEHCNSTPLMQYTNGFVECVVCRGSGSGIDGVYSSGTVIRENPGEIAGKDSNGNIPTAVMVDDDCGAHEEAGLIATVVAHDAQVAHDADCIEKMTGTATAMEQVNFPPTPKHHGCNIAEVFPSLKNLFSKKVDNEKDAEDRTEQAKRKISHLIAMGWEVSANHCTTCDMPLFTCVKGTNVQHLCVLCGPKMEKIRSQPVMPLSSTNRKAEANFQEKASNEMARLMLKGWKISSNNTCGQCLVPLLSNPETNETICVGCNLAQEPTHVSNSDVAQDILEIDNEQREEISQKMVHRVMSGWNIVEGQQCHSCFMPMMVNPRTNLPQCVSCQPENGMGMIMRQSGNQTYGSPFMGAAGTRFTTDYHGSSSLVLANSPFNPASGQVLGSDSDEFFYRSEMQKHFLLGWTLSEHRCPSCQNQLLTESFHGRYKCLFCGPQSYRMLSNMFPMATQFNGNVVGVAPSNVNTMRGVLRPIVVPSYHDDVVMRKGRDPTPSNVSSRVTFSNDTPVVEKSS